MYFGELNNLGVRQIKNVYLGIDGEFQVIYFDKVTFYRRNYVNRSRRVSSRFSNCLYYCHGISEFDRVIFPLDSVLFFSRVYVYVIPGSNNHSFINALSIQTRTASCVIVINRPAAQCVQSAPSLTLPRKTIK